MKLLLPPEIATPQELAAVRLELTGYIDWLHTRERFKGGGAAVTEPERSAALSALLRTNVPTTFTEADLAALSSALEEAEAHLPVVRLILAAPAGPELRRELAAWFRSEVGPGLLISFLVDRSLIGGAVIRAGSHLYDLSFRTLLWEGRGKLPELVGHV